MELCFWNRGDGGNLEFLFSACSCQINTSSENNTGFWCAYRSALCLSKKKKYSDISCFERPFFFCWGVVRRSAARLGRVGVFENLFSLRFDSCVRLQQSPFKRRMERRRRSRAVKSVKSCKTHLSVRLAANQTEREGERRKNISSKAIYIYIHIYVSKLYIYM